LRYATYITEVSFKREDGQACVHEGWKTCELCTPKDLTLIGHYDLDSTVAIAREAHLGMYDGEATKELLIRYFAVDQEGKKVPPHMMEHYSEEFVGPAEYIVSVENKYFPLTQEILYE
tara:strand:+ start:41 stop:394 length:354 start_codon:yes stop_codon:yes gene_type:complete